MLIKDKDILANQETTNINIKIKRPSIEKKNMSSAWGDAFDYYIRGVTEKYLQFHGRATRLEFWGFMVVSGIVFFPLYLLSGYIEMPLLCYYYLLATLIPTVAVAARRLHDINRNAFLYLISGIFLVLIGFIPHVGYWAVIPVLAWAIFLIKLFSIKSDDMENSYGVANDEDEIYGNDNVAIFKKFRLIALAWFVFWCGLTYTNFDNWRRQESYIILKDTAMETIASDGKKLGLTPQQIKAAQELMGQLLKDSSGQTINVDKSIQDILIKAKNIPVTQ